MVESKIIVDFSAAAFDLSLDLGVSGDVNGDIAVPAFNIDITLQGFFGEVNRDIAIPTADHGLAIEVIEAQIAVAAIHQNAAGNCFQLAVPATHFQIDAARKSFKMDFGGAAGQPYRDVGGDFDLQGTLAIL
jgi:hypothetical protein